MPPPNKNNNKVKKRKVIGIETKLADRYENHPFFVKRANEAKALLKKVGVPKEFVLIP